MDNTPTNQKTLAWWIKQRRTINLFDARPAPKDLLLEAIDCARWSPNHRLTEPWKYYVLGPKMVSKVVDLGVQIAVETKSEAAGVARQKRLDDIPGWFTMTSPRSIDSLLEKEDYAACCCAIQNLSLHLWEQGVGVKWTTGGIIRDPRFYEVMNIDQNKECVVGLFWYGYPRLIPLPQERKTLNDIVTITD